MSQDRILYKLYDDTIDRREGADKAEHKLSKQPDDMITRAQLVHFYYHQERRSRQKGICQGRLEHIAWFIENRPDLQFCGMAPFYLEASDPHFGDIWMLWQAAINKSPAEMRRVNACMYIANADHSEGLKFLNSVFLPTTDNIWVLALRDLLCNSQNCYLSALESERRKPTTIDDDCRLRLLLELKQNRDWDSVAISATESSPSYFSQVSNNDFDSTMRLSDVAKIAGYTLYRFQSSSILLFNPEILSLRFGLACWIIRHLPSSKLAVDPIFMGPFESPKSYDIIEPRYSKSLVSLYEFVAENWANQLRAFPKDKHVAKNAANFAFKAEKYFPAGAQAVIAELNQTPGGTAALKKMWQS